MMVIPVSQHKLIKIRRVNREKLIKFALICSVVACACNVLGSSTNHWLYTAEVLKYFMFPNRTHNFDDTPANSPVYFKNATIGPWLFCWLDPITEFHCTAVYYLQDDDPSDVTTSVQQSVRKAFLFMLTGMILDVTGLLLSFICFCLPNPYSSLLFSALLHINAGIANFACIIVYMSAVSKEVGNKIFPASEMDDPLFYVRYGFSFLLLKTSFLLTELAALFSIVVYMAKRDERTFNRYKIRSMLNFSRLSGEDVHVKTYYENSRYQRRTGSNCSNAPELDAMRASDSPKLPSPVRTGLQSLNTSILPDLLNLTSSPTKTATTKHKASSASSASQRATSRKQRTSPHSSRSQPLRRFAIPVNSPHYSPSTQITDVKD